MKTQHPSAAEQTHFQFYTYDPCGRDTVITLQANSCAEAFRKFDQIYGEDTLIDFCIERGQEYVEAIANAVQRGENV